MRRGASVVALVLAALACSHGHLSAQDTKPVLVTRQFSPRAHDWHYHTADFILGSNTVSDAEDGTTRLARSHFVTEEVGATDYKQTESLGPQVQAKKVFVLDDADVGGAELFFFGSAKEVAFNGHPLPAPEKLASTGWSRVKLPTAHLKMGKNEVVFRGGGQLLVEPSRSPGHSFKSSDGGQTWSREGLTSRSNQEGEYVVRLRLGRYAPQGWAATQVFDLWPADPVIAAPHRLVAVPVPEQILKGQPARTALTMSIRTGPTPSLDEKAWTPWVPLNRPYRPEGKAAEHRWAQLKFELRTDDPQATPRVPAEFPFGCEMQPLPVATQHLKLSGRRQPDGIRGRVPFVYQAPSPRLKLLRERYKLDEVIAPGESELEKLMLLRHWVRHQWHTAWKGHAAQWMPPWDTLMILANRDQPDCLTMCTHYGAVFTQCCLALGWDARHCILDHHCVAEVYSREHDRWVMMDAGNSAQRADVNLHFERAGRPLSARELHLAYTDGKTDGITVHFTPAKLAEKIAPLCRPDPKAGQFPTRPDVIPLAELKNYPVCQIENYRRYAFPGRNNYLDSLFPGELYQGWSSYFFDGYWWVGDSPDNPSISPEYSWHLDPRRPQDADWKLGWTRIHLSRTDKPGQLRVDLETHTPNFTRFVKDAPHGQRETCPSSFVWQLRPGANELTVRSVNAWDREGTPATVSVGLAAGEK